MNKESTPIPHLFVANRCGFDSNSRLLLLTLFLVISTTLYNFNLNITNNTLHGLVQTAALIEFMLILFICAIISNSKREFESKQQRFATNKCGIGVDFCTNHNTIILCSYILDNDYNCIKWLYYHSIQPIK